MKSLILLGTFQRPPKGISWTSKTYSPIPFKGGIGWQSNGGPTRSHPHRALPYTLEILLPINLEEGPLIRIHLVGIFAVWAGAEGEKGGDLGANIFLLQDENPVFNYNLIYERHYFNASQHLEGCRLNGDGSSLETIDFAEHEEKKYRVDLLSLEIPSKMKIDKLQFCVHRTPASFVIFDVAFEFGVKRTCPFRSNQGLGVSLTEIGVILRMQDRLKFYTALEQLKHGILSANDIDEARSLALTFVAVVSASLLELDAPRGLHRLQLDMARKLDQVHNKSQVSTETFRIVRQITQHLISFDQTSRSPLIDRALAFVDKHFAREIGDQSVAKHLSMSTSHFRHLFKEYMDQPFHKYLVGLRLERARLLLLQTDLHVHDIARAVGFNNISHFCRAFNKRFYMSPSSLRTPKKNTEPEIKYELLTLKEETNAP